MRTVPIPGTDLAPGALCLGTNMFGTALDAAAAGAILDTFLSAGGTLIDTAHSYGDWVPGVPRAAGERVLGELLARKPRASYLIATKGCEFDYRAGDYALRVTPAHLAADLEGSLRNLGVERIDLYWLHRDDPSQPVSAILDALLAHQAAGRIRYFGCSNWSPARIAEAQAYARSLGHPGFVACQPMWGLAQPDRGAMQQYAPGGYYEDGFRELHAAGLAMIPYSGQSRGYFSKLDRGATLPADIAALYDNDANRRRLPLLRELAARHGTDVNGIVLAYLCSQPLPTIPIIGASSAAQLKDSIAALSVRLDASELARLRDA